MALHLSTSSRPPNRLAPCPTSTYLLHTASQEATRRDSWGIPHAHAQTPPPLRVPEQALQSPWSAATHPARRLPTGGWESVVGGPGTGQPWTSQGKARFRPAPWGSRSATPDYSM